MLLSRSSTELHNISLETYLELGEEARKEWKNRREVDPEEWIGFYNMLAAHGPVTTLDAKAVYRGLKRMPHSNLHMGTLLEDEYLRLPGVNNKFEVITENRTKPKTMLSTQPYWKKYVPEVLMKKKLQNTYCSLHALYADILKLDPEKYLAEYPHLPLDAKVQLVATTSMKKGNPFPVGDAITSKNVRLLRRNAFYAGDCPDCHAGHAAIIYEEASEEYEAAGVLVAMPDTGIIGVIKPQGEISMLALKTVRNEGTYPLITGGIYSLSFDDVNKIYAQAGVQQWEGKKERKVNGFPIATVNSLWARGITYLNEQVTSSVPNDISTFLKKHQS